MTRLGENWVTVDTNGGCDEEERPHGDDRGSEPLSCR